MANTYTKIASVTVGAGGASSIDFTSIPSTYTDLVVKYSIRTSADNITAELSLNGVKTNMTQRYLQGTGSSASSGNSTAINVMEDPSTATASTFASADLYIPNYASSNYKSISIDTVTEKNATDAYSRLVAALWSNTAAITSIGLTCAAAGNFVQYSTATLYGVTKYAETGVGSKAIGGTVTTSGSYTIHTFTSTGMFTPTASITGADVLIVAGGGGGGGYWGGGGGAGGFQTLTSQSFSSGTGYAAIVGAGGAGGIGAIGNKGCDSSFASTTSTGGGYGGYGAVGGGGGSGGGGGYQYAGGSGTAGQGNSGGQGSISGFLYATGGGGGASAAGSASSNGTSGSGGAGTANSYSGSSVTYAGGGGGGGRTVNSNVSGSGGSGGGGAGGSAGGSTTAANGTSGTANTGGGGGGSLSDGSTYITGGNGGSGIIIVRYLT